MKYVYVVIERDDGSSAIHYAFDREIDAIAYKNEISKGYKTSVNVVKTEVLYYNEGVNDS